MTRRSRRNAVLAPLTRWLWWSPWRLLSTTVIVVIASGVVLALLRSGPRPLHSSAPAPTRSSVTTQPSADSAATLANDTGTGPAAAPLGPTRGVTSDPVPTSVTATISLPAPANDRRQAVDAATAWAKLWARPTLPARQWLAALTPGTFRDYLPTLATVDPANVPADAVAGTASVQAFGPGAARIAVPVNNKADTSAAMHTVALQLIWYPTSTAGHWVVSGVDGN